MIPAPSYRHCCRCKEDRYGCVPVAVIESATLSGWTLYACPEHAEPFPPLEEPDARFLPERDPLPPVTLAFQLAPPRPATRCRAGLFRTTPVQ